jgi:hypothetical protein
MGRGKKIESTVLIDLIDRYLVEKCDGDTNQLRIPRIGKFVREKGYQIQDYLIRRNKQVREHIVNLEKRDRDENIPKISSFRDIDYNAFFEKNRTKEKMIIGLRERDNYYRDITLSAHKAFQEHEKGIIEIAELKKEYDTLSALYTSQKNQLDNYKSENRTLKRDNDVLRDIVKKYVYPNIANQLLQIEGLAINTPDIIDPEKLNREIITAGKDVDEIQTKVIKVLFNKVEQ